MSILEELGIIPGTGAEKFNDEVEPPVRDEFKLEIKETKSLEIQDSDAIEDYKYARSVLYAMSAMNLEMANRSLQVARETEHPRAFEAFNSLTVNVRDTMRDLMALHKTHKEVMRDAKVIDKHSDEEEDPNQSTHKVFAANTNDMLKQIEKEEAEARAAEEGNPDA